MNEHDGCGTGAEGKTFKVNIVVRVVHDTTLERFDQRTDSFGIYDA